MLKKRNIEGYLLDDEVLFKWCDVSRHPELKDRIKDIKAQRLHESIERGNSADDLKSAANVICADIKKEFNLTRCGNNGENIMRDTISKIITEDMNIYKQLEQDIFE